ncbi:MAG: ubiquinone biosynthesis protein, partial [Polynucleobacter victoriensis]
EKIHVWDALDSGRIQVVSDMRIYGDSGAVGDELHFSAYSATVPQLAWIVESGHIEKTLDQACKFQGLIQRVTDKLVDFKSDQESVTVTTESGEIYGAKLLLAADGARS